MSRTKLVLALAGVTLAAGAAGWAFGLLSAPVSGKELRRRLAWRAEEECRGASKASRAFLGRVVSRAKAEIDHQRARLGETMTHG
ncbi:MAG: hypothetical protein HYY76_04845 [Acidobacteria bacterium]|nr:hypothetical protein [Acidobacteriota bacterium]